MSQPNLSEVQHAVNLTDRACRQSKPLDWQIESITLRNTKEGIRYEIDPIFLDSDGGTMLVYHTTFRHALRTIDLRLRDHEDAIHLVRDKLNANQRLARALGAAKEAFSKALSEDQR